MKKVYVGKEGSGKTLFLGREAERLIYRNEYLGKKMGITRPLVTNFNFSIDFIKFASEHGVEIRKWQHVSELESFSECDLFIDELGTYFDSRTFENLSLDTRLWLAQAQKLGVHIYGSAQDWGQIDITFRRLTNELYEVKKLFGSRRPSKTLPSSKLPFAVGLRWRLNPVSSGEEGLKSMWMFPSLFVVTRKDTNRFNTNDRVKMSDPPPLRKVSRHWTNPETGLIEKTITKYY